LYGLDHLGRGGIAEALVAALVLAALVPLAGGWSLFRRAVVP
jgi:hypothetical protein